MYDSLIANVREILDKLIQGLPLEAHENAALAYTAMVLRDYKVKTNDQLVRALRSTVRKRDFPV